MIDPALPLASAGPEDRHVPAPDDPAAVPPSPPPLIIAGHGTRVNSGAEAAASAICLRASSRVRPLRYRVL